MKPGQLDLPTIWRGCDWPPVVLNWKDANGNPFDLTGWSPKATTVSGYDLNAAVTNATGGVTHLKLSNAQTADFTLGTQAWDWIWEDLTNLQAPYRYPPFLAGKVTIKEPVTGTAGFPAPIIPPPNDNFANAILIPGGTTGSLTGTNLFASHQSGEPPGAASVWYKFMPLSDWDAEFYIDSFFLTIDVYHDTDGTLQGLDPVTTSGTSNPSRVLFHAFAGRTYYIRLSTRSLQSPFTLVWVLHTPQPPNPPSNDNFAQAIQILHPTGNLVGTTVGATIETNEPDPPGLYSVWYYWVASDNGTMTVHLNNNINQFSIYRGLSITSLFHVVDSGGNPQTALFNTQAGLRYYFRVYRNSGVSQFTLTWSFVATGPTPPPNDNFAQAQLLAHPSGVLEGTTLNATVEPTEVALLGPGLFTVWYSWLATGDGTMTVTLDTNSNQFGIYRGLIANGLTGLFHISDSSGNPPTATFPITSGLTYNIRVFRNVAPANFSLTWTATIAGPPPAPPNDLFANAQHILHPSGSLTGTTLNSTAEGGEPPPSAAFTVWYYWLATQTGTMKFSLDEDNTNKFTIYRGITIGGLFHVIDSTGNPQTASFTPNVGSTYYIRVSRNFDTGPFTLTWLFPP